MSELIGWIQVGLGVIGLMVAIVGLAVSIIDLKLKSPPEGGDKQDSED